VNKFQGIIFLRENISPDASNRDPIIEDIQKRTFQWFWESGQNSPHCLIPDRNSEGHLDQDFTSIAATGFALTAYAVGVERGYIARHEAAERTYNTLHFFATAPQGDGTSGFTGYNGFFYHFLHKDSGTRYNTCELSSIDTALLLAGALFAQAYYSNPSDPLEKAIRNLSGQIYSKVNWSWMRGGADKKTIAMGWLPESGGSFVSAPWLGYNEAMILYILALGAPTFSLPPSAWKEGWTSNYYRQICSYQDKTLLRFAPMFGHQYSHIWLDFKGIQDDWNKENGLDYFENSCRATYHQQAYAVANPLGFKGYGENVWGLTACDGPANDSGGEPYWDAQGKRYFGYTARGAGRLGVINPADAYTDAGGTIVSDDGTIAPTAAGGSIAFAPDIVIPTLKHMKNINVGNRPVYGKYGFFDAFNLTVNKSPYVNGWVGYQYIGIDQGPIVLMIENYYSRLIWDTMKKNSYIRDGLKRAGFTGGWLNDNGYDGLVEPAR